MKSLYFSHDFNARNDPKMIKLAKQGWDLIGLFWAITEMLHEQNGYLAYDFESIAYVLRTDTERIAKVIDSDLFIRDGDKFTSDRILQNLNKINTKSEKAKNSAKTRWNNANAMPMHSECNAIKEDKIKEDNINTYVLPVFNYFILKTKRSFKLTKDKTELILKRIQDGFTVDQIKTAIDNFVKDEWPERKNRMDLIYCIGKQKGKPDNLEKWLNFKPEQKGIKI